MYKYCILGSDERTNCLRKLYRKEKQIVDLKKADVVITAIPFTKDGKNLNGENIKCEEFIKDLKNKILISGAIPNQIKKVLDEEKITYFDMQENDSFAIKNAVPTAEGAIELAIKNTDFTLHNSNVLILGFGRIGKILSKMLYGFGANVFVYARKKEALSLIETYGYNKVKIKDLNENISKADVIFNTIPSLMLDKKRLEFVKENTLVIDLASNPGGIDFAEAKRRKLRVEWALALPTKIAPVTSAKYLKEEIDDILD